MQLNKIPATVVTGFLGSGKTTLLSQVLKQAKGKRIAVIVNEFGELDIDADLLRSCPLECEADTEQSNNAQQQSGIYELANGCICCTVEEEFLPVMQQLVARRDDIDHILIETSGLALPKPLVQAFNWPDIKPYCTVDAVITIIDGPAVAEGKYASNPEAVQQQRLADENLEHDPSLQELLDDQLQTADLVLVSKKDLITEDQQALVENYVHQQVPNSVKTHFFSQKPATENSNATQDAHFLAETLLTGLHAASEDHIEKLHTHHDHHHSHDEEHHHAHDHFDSHCLTLEEVNSQTLIAVIHELMAEFNIFRVKGFAALPSKPMRQVIQAVGKRVDTYFDRPWQTTDKRQTRLVVIGKNLCLETITKRLQTAQLTP